MKKWILFATTMTLMFLASTYSVFAGEWKNNSVGWWYEAEKGDYTIETWEKIDGSWYYFDSLGYMKTGWIQDTTGWYFLNLDGKMATNQWIDNYYVDESGKYQEKGTSETKSIFREFYKNNISDKAFKNAFLEDMDHDGNNELILVDRRGFYDSYEALSVDVYKVFNGQVKQIYNDCGGADHANGFFNMNLYHINGEAYFGKTIYSMWQGYGTVSLEIFYLLDNTSTDNWVENEKIVKSISVGNADDTTIVSQDELDKFEFEKQKIVNEADFAFTLISSISGDEVAISNPENILN